MKTCLIIGSRSDIGLACAQEFAKHGFDLILASRNADEEQNRTASDLAIRYSVKTFVTKFEGSDLNSHHSFYETLPQKPDVVICAIGYLGDHEKAKTDSLELEKIMVSNFLGCASVLNHVANDFEAQKAGCIIGISSVAGERGRGSNYFYGSSKAAFSAYLSGLRNRLHPSGVNVISVKPGFVKTKMIAHLQTPKPLTASPEEVAQKIWQAFKKRKHIVYVKWHWRYIVLIIKLLPEGIFKKMKL